MKMIDRIENAFYMESSRFAPTVIRVGMCFFFIWKLLSRDFSVLTSAPDVVLNFYPSDQFPINLGYAALGFKPIVDIFTFHWVHWWLPMPSASTIQVIQIVTVGLFILYILFGRGPLRIFAISSLILSTYLWGYLYRSGGELDGIFEHFQILIMMAFFSGAEGLTVLGNRDSKRDENVFYSSILAIICFGYFIPGLNKLIDINFKEWFEFYVVQTSSNIADWRSFGFYYNTPVFFSYLKNLTFINYIGVPLTYLMEICAPVLLFRRQLIPFFAGYFILFHFITWSLIAFFYGYIFLWVLITVPYLFYRISIYLGNGSGKAIAK